MFNQRLKKIAFSDNSEVQFSVVRKVFYTFLYHKKILMKGGEEKMKRMIALLAIVGIVSFVVVSPANSDTTTGNIPVTASIQAGTPDMTFEIHKMNDGDPDQDPWTNYTEESSLIFDNWDVLQKPDKPAQWVSVTKNTVIIWASGHGEDYQIYSDGSGALTGPGGALPAGSLMCKPIYAVQDEWSPGNPQGPMPGGATLGGAAKGLKMGNPVYTSESPVGSARILQVLYMFPAYNDDGSDPYLAGYEHIPTSIAAGTYTGANIVIRIVSM